MAMSDVLAEMVDDGSGSKMIKVCVTGASGFVGGHLCRYLKERGYWVRAVDKVEPRYGPVSCNEHSWTCDLRHYNEALRAVGGMDWVFALAADMGGAGYIFTGEHDKEILHNNALINLNTLKCAELAGVRRYLFASSACVYPEHLQQITMAVTSNDFESWTERLIPKPLKEDDAYPAQPDSPYGWEKLFAERLCLAYRASDFKIKIARFHNVYGPQGAWNDGKEKAPAAMCRKVAVAKLTNNPIVKVWGTGKQMRSYMYIDDCVQGLMRLIQSDFDGPVNIGRDRCVSVDELVDIVAGVAGVEVEKKHVEGPTGVAWRNSDNSLCKERLGWEPETALEDGLVPTYQWIEERVRETIL